MSIIETLITDRTQADVTKLRSLLSKPKAMWTNEEWSEFLLAKDKGAYNATDLNRVQEAMEYLAERFRGYGYNVPEIKRPSITEVIPGTSKLPEGYTELEYIRSTGEQYVDTKYNPSGNARVICSFQNESSGITGAIFAVRSSVASMENAFGVYVSTSNAYMSIYGTAYTKIGTANNVKTELDMNGLSGEVTVEDKTTTFSTLSFASDYPLYLFAMDTGGNAGDFGRFKLYFCQIHDNGTLVRDFVPCLNPSNEVGLYDIVNGVFYGNAGTGYFLPGPVVSLPEGYTRLEYIKSTGAQRIDTRYKPNQNTRVVCDLQADILASAGTFPFGCWTSQSKDGFDVALTTTQVFHNCGSHYQFASYTNPYERMLVDANKNIATFTGSEIVTISLTASSFSGSRNLLLFTADNNGSPYTGSNAWNGKAYCFVVYDNDSLIRLYTPALNADGEAGLYDSVTREFYGNAGTGVFGAGAKLPSTGGGNIPDQPTERDYWEIGDIPRREQMDLYLSNLSLIRSINDVMKSTPEIPGDMEGLLHTEANDIEQILFDVDYLLSVMVLNWFYTAEVFCGEV